MTSGVRLRLALLSALLCPCPAAAEVLVRLPASATERIERSSELADAEKRLRTLLTEPTKRREEPSGIVLRAAAWRVDAAERRETEIRELRRRWTGLRVEEDSHVAARSAMPAMAPTRRRDIPLPRVLDAGLTRESQDRFYDGTFASGREPSLVASGAGVSRAPVAKVSVFSSPQRMRRPADRIPQPSHPGKGEQPSLVHGAWEAAKGGGGVIKDMISVKGLVVAVGAVALVTVAPVTVYGLLAVGAAVGGWTIGKALLHGSSAYRDGDTARFNEACREFGRGALSLGLALYGARYAPTNLKPHVPRTSGEWKALSTSMDDESVVLFSLLRGKGSAPEPPPR